MTLLRRIADYTKNGPAWTAGLLALIGLIVYLVQAFWYAHTSISSLDEGAYLYKGLLFASGQYRPFEPYGVWTNKAPLAFLIPGAAELIFEPGLRTGRYLAIIFGALALAATWFAARRLAGKWLAAAAVWGLVLSPVLVRTYSEAVTQSTIAFMLALTFALALGTDRPAWQLVTSGLVAGLMIMVRQNMVLVLPLLVLYILWQHGRKPALYAALAGSGTLLLFHALYWPNVLQLWLPWIPGAGSLFPDVVLQTTGVSNWNPAIDLTGRLLSFFQGMRFHFLALTGLLVGLILWPKREGWATEEHFRAAVFLAATFAGLLVMHSWASISNDYCVFCFSPYLAFFSISAILFLVLFVRAQWNLTPLRKWLLIAFVIIAFTGLGYSAFEDLGDGILNLNVPRVRDGRILPGSTTLWELISNKFAPERNPAERIVSAVAGFMAGVGLLLLAFVIFKRWRHADYGHVLVSAMLVLGLLLGPWTAGSAGRADCATDVIAANESVGAYLAEHIPADSTVFWNGGLSWAPMLYLAGVDIHPPQINNGYSFYVGGDPQELLKYGMWNDVLSARWLAEADFVIVEGWRYSDMKDSLPAAQFDEMPRSPVQTSCLEGSGLRIFRRK